MQANTRRELTLILTAGNRNAIHQSSDYRLVEPSSGRPLADEAGSKQLVAQFDGLELQVAFTGVAIVCIGGRNRWTVDWLENELKSLPPNSDLQQISRALSTRAGDAMKPLGQHGVLTIVLTAAMIGKPLQAAVISNVDWRTRPPKAKSTFRISIERVNKPFVRVYGYRDCISASEQDRLYALLIDNKKPISEIASLLAELNKAASEKSCGYISEECWISSQYAELDAIRSQTQNAGALPGRVISISPGSDFLDKFVSGIQKDSGKKLSVIQTASVITGPKYSNSLPPAEGDPRKFTLSAASSTFLLLSPAGQPSASLEIVQLPSQIEIRRNEIITLPFARATVTPSYPFCSDFEDSTIPRNRPEALLMLDGVHVPNGWRYAVHHWIKHSICYVKIMPSSRGIRNVAFLSDDDEITLFEPTSETEIAIKEQDGPVTVTLEARISWRRRLEQG